MEAPILNTANTDVIGFNSKWHPERPFPIDMAGFAISGTRLIPDDILFDNLLEPGMQESNILSQVVEKRSDLQPLASNCTKVLVWHTRTEKPKLIFD